MTMFKFRLQAVLEYRKTMEERTLLRFSEAARRLDAEKRQLDLLEQEKCNLVGILKGLQENATPVENIALLAGYIGELQARGNRQREIIYEVSMELDEKRRELMECVQKRKMLEKLREKHLEDYRQNLAVYDRKVMDEMGITRFAGAKS